MSELPYDPSGALPIGQNPFAGSGASQLAQLLQQARAQLESQPQRVGPPDIGEPAVGDGGQFSPGTAVGNRAADIGSKLGYGAIEGLATLPRRALEASAADVGHLGEAGYEPQSIAPATDAAFTLAGLGAPMAEAGAAGIFGGRLAKTADHAALARAEEMAASGAPREAIHAETGWFQGPDQKWRFEIPDNTSRIGVAADGDLAKTGEANGTAPQILWHKDLYDAYPQMRATNVRAIATPIEQNMGRVGGYHAGGEGDSFIEARAPGPDALRSVMLHELQHDTQRIEGFAPGGNQYGLKLGTPAWDIYQERLKAIGTPLSFEDFVKQAGYDDLKQAAKDYGPYLKGTRSPSPMVDRAAQDYAVQEAYRRQAGEVEARNVQTRRDMTPEERRATPPWQTQDTPDINQIIRMGMVR